jgi:t-SNARE complex subunit (syntaxin)
MTDQNPSDEKRLHYLQFAMESFHREQAKVKELEKNWEREIQRKQAKMKQLEKIWEREIQRKQDIFEEEVARLERTAAKEKCSRQNMQAMLERIQTEAHNTEYKDVEQFVLDYLPWEWTRCKHCHVIVDPFRAETGCRNCCKGYD